MAGGAGMGAVSVRENMRGLPCLSRASLLRSMGPVLENLALPGGDGRSAAAAARASRGGDAVSGAAGSSMSWRTRSVTGDATTWGDAGAPCGRFARARTPLTSRRCSMASHRSSSSFPISRSSGSDGGAGAPSPGRGAPPWARSTTASSTRSKVAVRSSISRRRSSASASSIDADEAHRGRVDRVWDRRDCGALEAASLAGDAYGALPALNVTAAFDSLCGALDKRDAKSSPTTDAILLPVICMYAALFVLHPLVLRDSKKFQQVVQIVVIEADDGLAEARAQLARQQLQGVFELSGAPRSMIGVEDDSVLVEALAMPTRLLKHSSTLYARAAVAPLDVDDALPPLGLQLPDLKAAAAPPDVDDAPETPRKPPRKVLEAPAAPEDDGAAAAGDGGAAPEVGDGDDDDDASLGSSACESSIFDDGALDADLDAPPPRRAASPVKDKHLCYVCCLARRNAVIMECGHGGLCFECGKSLAQRHPRTCQRPVAVKIFERFWVGKQ